MQYVGYVYNVETRVLVAEIHGTMERIENYVNNNYDGDIFGFTYTPAFGANDGLIGDSDSYVVKIA